MPLSNDQCVLVVEGLPPYFSGLEEALIEYMKNTTKTQPIISCEIENGKARIKFNNSSGEENGKTYMFQLHTAIINPCCHWMDKGHSSLSVCMHVQGFILLCQSDYLYLERL